MKNILNRWSTSVPVTGIPYPTLVSHGLKIAPVFSTFTLTSLGKDLFSQQLVEIADIKGCPRKKTIGGGEGKIFSTY